MRPEAISSLFIQAATAREALGSCISIYSVARKLWQYGGLTLEECACRGEGLKVLTQWDHGLHDVQAASCCSAISNGSLPSPSLRFWQLYMSSPVPLWEPPWC